MDNGRDSAHFQNPQIRSSVRKMGLASHKQNGAICAERERLLQTVKEAVNKHGQRVSALVDIIEAESSNCPKAIPLRDKIAIAGSKVKAAWDVYHQHLQEHGC